MVVRVSDKNQNYNNVTKLLVKPNKISGFDLMKSLPNCLPENSAL